MQKLAPSPGRIAVIALFALSCFGLLLFLWLSFGGSVPLKPRGYRFTVVFPQADQLADQADVRISGVPVGRVIKVGLGPGGNTSEATIEMQARYAPVHADVRAIVRAKTLLGEAYVELTPGSRSAPAVPEGGTLGRGQVAPTVALDEIYRAFDPRTRAAFQSWMQSLAAGLGGEGPQLNAALANFDPFVQDTSRLLALLQSQRGAVARLVSNTGVVFDALSARDNQLRDFVVASGRTFSATAAANQALADTFRALPPFERAATTALRQLDAFAVNTSPLLTQLVPVEQALTPALQGAQALSPGLDRLLTGLAPLTQASKRGLPALDGSLADLAPLLGQLSPVLRNLNPVLQFGDLYLPELEAFFANSTAATQAHNVSADVPTGPQLHYLRVSTPLNPESLSVSGQRTGSGRSNAYQLPGAFAHLAAGLPMLQTATCSNPTPGISGPPNATVSQSILDQIVALGVAGVGPNAPVPAPPCKAQSPLSFGGQSLLFPHVNEAPR